MRNTVRFFAIYLMVLLLAQGCTEPYSPETESFEDLLVVEATITNELTQQKVRLTRTYSFEDLQTFPETGAEVKVSDNMGNQYSFQYQAEDSTYYSTTEFQVVPENEYTLSILTENGETYRSTPETMPTANQVELSVEQKEVDGVLGVQIAANSYDPTNSSHYYRYEYMETYKVIPEFWSAKEAYIDEEGVVQNRFKEDPQADRVCYKTLFSENIKITSSVDLPEDRIEDFPVRFIEVGDYMLRYKYSILVTQYVENSEAFQFYESLKNISGTGETILSPSQPGFVQGNISSQDNSSEKVIGYFNLATVSSQRIFLDHATLFPNHPDPVYFRECEIRKWDKNDFAVGGPKEGLKLEIQVTQGTLLFYKEDPLNIYWMVEPPCSSCTTFASNEIPEFWE